MTTPSAPLGEMIDQIDAAPNRATVRIGDVVKDLGKASFTPLLVLPALALVTPLSGIPFFSTVMGVWIVLVSAQMILRRDHVWLPRWLLNVHTEQARVTRALDWARPVTR